MFVVSKELTVHYGSMGGCIGRFASEPWYFKIQISSFIGKLALVFTSG